MSMPTIIPGSTPPINILATDTPVMLPKTIIVILGGIMTPIDPAAAWRAEEKSLGYPDFTIAGTMIEPSAAVSALPEPEIPPSNI